MQARPRIRFRTAGAMTQAACPWKYCKKGSSELRCSDEDRAATFLVITQLGVIYKGSRTAEMIDPYIAEAMTSAVADAVVGVAVQASTPAWKQLIARSKRDPKILEDNTLWNDVKLSIEVSEIIVNYIDSPRARGLLQILAYVMQADDQGPGYEYQTAQLGAAFIKELLDIIGDTNSFLERFASDLWTILVESVRLQLNATKDDDSFVANKFLALAITDRKNSVPESDIGKLSKRAKETVSNRPKAVKIASIVPERSSLSNSLQRSNDAIILAQEIRESFRASYSHIIMPHARDDYRILLEDLYVDRSMALIDSEDLKNLYISFQDDPADPTTTYSELEVNDRRYVLIGNPGAGKSTFVRHLMYEICRSSGTAIGNTPLIVELKSYSAEKPKAFHEIIANRLRYMDQIDVKPSVIADILVLGYGLVVFDGLDEISNLSLRRDAVLAIESFCRRYPLTRVVVTSRPEGYSGAPLNPLMFSAYRLPDFSESQVVEYVSKWFQATRGTSGLDSSSAAKGFLRDSAIHAPDLRVNPLMLSLLCMVYRYVGYIPENRPQIYEQCTELLFSRWDTVRHVRPDIEPDIRGKYLVQELAYYFFKHQMTQGGIEERMLLLVLQDYIRRYIVADVEVARNRARDFLDYCAGRAWVITMIGTSPRGDRVFSFTHRTFMEYFVACYLVRQNTGVREFVRTLHKYILEGSSDVIPQIAIQRYGEIAVDGIDDCLSALLFDSTSITHKVDCKYLPFVIRCVQSMHPSPGAVEKIFYAAIKCYVQTRKDSLFIGLDVSDGDYAASLESFVQDLISKDSNTDAEVAIRIGCYQLLIVQGGSRFSQLRAAVCSYLKVDLSRFKRSFPDVLNAMVRHKDITPQEFGSACSAEQLIRTTRFAHMKTIRENGALIQELRTAFKDIKDLRDGSIRQGQDASYDMTPLTSRLGPGSVLREVISYLFSSPDTVSPVHAETMTALVDAMEAADRFTKQVVRDFMTDSHEFRALTIFSFMGACEINYGAAIFTSAWTGKAIDEEHLRRIEYAREDGIAIDRGSLICLRRYSISDPWLKFIKSWALGERSVLIDEEI